MKLNTLLSSLVWCASVIYAGPFAYVANNTTDTINPIDLRTNTILNSISTLATYPWKSIVTPDNKTLYVVNSTTFGASSVTPIDIKTSTADQPITVGDVAYDIAITPDGTTLYVTNSSSFNITPIDTATNTAGTPITVPGVPYGIAITPDGKTAYVTMTSTDTNIPGGVVIPIDLATNTLGNAISVDLFPVAITIIPDGTTAYIANLGTSTITVLSLANNKVTKTIPINAGPVALISDELNVYVANSNASTISVINIGGNNVTSIIPLDSFHPIDLAFSPDHRTLYVTSTIQNAVLPINIQTQTIGEAITGFISPHGISVTPATLPPSNFIGAVTKNIYTGESILSASWQASPAVDVVLYRLYLEDRVVDEILAGFPLTITACIVSQQDAQEYEVVAVSANNLESKRVKIKLLV